LPVVNKLSTGAKIDSDCLTPNVLAQLERKMFLDGRRAHANGRSVYLDNCSVHTSGASHVYLAEHSMIRLKHPPYWPNLALSDFWSFPTVTERLKHMEMVEEEDLFNRLKDILNEIPRKELDKVLGAWINRPMTGSGGNGGYIS
jgi:hypothetical protein